MSTKERKTYRVIWHAVAFELHGCYYFDALSPESAVEAAKDKVKRDHDMTIAIDSCVEDNWQDLQR